MERKTTIRKDTIVLNQNITDTKITMARKKDKRDKCSTMAKRQNTKERGITLIALIVTIIILIILAVVSINAIFGADGLINEARRTNLMVDFMIYIDEKKTYDSEKKYEDSNYEQESLNAGRTTLIYNTQEETDGNIQTVIPSMTDEMAEKFEIIKGEFLLYEADELEREVATELGIKLSPYIIENGVLVSANENLELQAENGVVTLPERVTEIGAGAFSGVKGLKEIIIPGTVKVIDRDAFSYNTEIEKVTIENGVLSIGEDAFRECTELKEITIPDSVIEIGESAFRSCHELVEVKLSNNLEVLEGEVFRSCSELTTINMPKNLKDIYSEAFTNCYKLDNIHIPAGVTDISGGAFAGCTNLYNLTIDEANEYYEVEDGIIYKKDNSELILLAPISEKETVTIKEGIKELSRKALSICENMKTLNLPSTLEYIRGSTFSGLELLENINIPESNSHYKAENGYLYSKDGTELIYVVPTKTKINISSEVEIIKNLSIGCEKITELIIPDNVKEIEAESLSGSSNIKRIEIGKGMEFLNNEFKAWCGLENIELIIDEENPYYKVDGNFILTKDGKEVVTFINNDDTLNIPQGIEKLQDNSLTDFQGKEIILPTTLIEIGARAIHYCPYIEKIEIPNNVEIIGESAFSGCNNLAEIRIDKEAGSIAGSPWKVPKGDRAVIWLK